MATTLPSNLGGNVAMREMPHYKLRLGCSSRPRRQRIVCVLGTKITDSLSLGVCEPYLIVWAAVEVEWKVTFRQPSRP